jgi:hypothetical protein
MRNFGTWEGIMGTRVSVSKAAPSVDRRVESPTNRARRHTTAWNPEKFAQEQIRGLVRQVFLANGTKPIRQVVFSATEQETDVRSLCLRVAECLALETCGNIAVVGKYPQICQTFGMDSEHASGSWDLQKISTRLRSNLWLVPSTGFGSEEGCFTAASLHSFLCELRREFEYSIVVGAPADEWNRAAAVGQLADGVILVLSAQRTRRVTARNIKEALERADARILGTVLSDRDFPIPEEIYQRL